MTQRQTIRPAVWMASVLILVCAGRGVVGSDEAGGEGGLTDRQLTEHVREIDRLVEEGLREGRERPNPPLDEERFLRRVYLDITGTIPTHEQASEYLRSNDRDKRGERIDDLLDSPGYVSHSFNYFADLLRATTRLNNNVSGRTYIEWVKQSLRENKPYDEFVYELLTATGRAHESGPAGYYLRDSGMPLDNTANTVQLFLGTSIGCAMCHDHPFDKWSQLEFYEMASFTFGARTRDRGPVQKQTYRLAKDLNEEAPDDRESSRLANVLRRIGRGYSYKVHDTNRKPRLPHDYKYSDAEPNEAVGPFTIFGEVVEEAEEGYTLRETYARWVTSKDNPRFAKVIANRLWKRAFGLGIIEPVDELTDWSEPANPALMEYLTQLIKDLDFDMKQYMRVLYNTRAYQREASRQQRDPDEPYLFPGPILRRMTAEQMWDSFVTLAVPDIDSRRGYSRNLEYIATDLGGMSDSRMLAYARDIMSGGGGAMMGMRGERRSGAYANMVRASELRSPAPPGHFLWRFGQSDRQLIQNGSTDPSVTQVLTLLNGPIDRVLLQDESVLYRNVMRASSNREKFNVIWLSILGRRPNEAEHAAAAQEVEKWGDVAFDNLVWALLNTREFMFIQ